MLDGLDRELQRRGHTFVRYADEANVYLRSAKAAHKAFAAIEHFLSSRLKLQINPTKSAVAPDVWQELDGSDTAQAEVPAVAPSQAPGRSRQVADQEWTTRAARVALGLKNGRGAWWNAGASHMNAALPKSFFDRIGLVSLADTHRRFQSSS